MLAVKLCYQLLFKEIISNLKSLMVHVGMIAGHRHAGTNIKHNNNNSKVFFKKKMLNCAEEPARKFKGWQKPVSLKGCRKKESAVMPGD